MECDQNGWLSGSSTMSEHLPRHPEVKGSSEATTKLAVIERN
jgi:hypothetical protein